MAAQAEQVNGFPPTSTMVGSASRSLPDVPDVLHHVFSFLDPIHQFQRDHDKVYESRRSLALAARTCRGFAGPALDVLWKRLPDDQPLADLLCEVGMATREGRDEDIEVLLGKDKPGRYRLPNQSTPGYIIPIPGTEHPAVVYERNWRLLRGYDTRYHLRLDMADPRQHPGWLRFVEYASRIRSITLFAFDGPAWCELWEELRSRADGAPILPNVLTVAFCRISWKTLNPGVLALISPSVRKLNFNLENRYSWPDVEEKLRCLFSQAFTAAPEIDQLRLELPPCRLGSPLLRSHCSRVHRLEIDLMLDIEALRPLSELPALQCLSIQLSSENFPEANLRGTLKFITTLSVGGTWVNVSTLLNTISLPSMHTLSVTGWAYGEPAAELAKGAIQCFRTISAKHSSIASLSISTTFGRMPPDDGCVVYGVSSVQGTFEGTLLDLTHPLLSLSALRDLSLNIPSYFDLTCTASCLCAVSEAFPVLEALHLNIYYRATSYKTDPPVPGPKRPPGGPLDALVHFARNCPRLRLLHLPAMELVEAEAEVEMVPMDSEDRRGEPAHGLRTLVIPEVLLPPCRADLASKVSEVVKVFFPVAECALRPARVVVREDLPPFVDGCAASARCPGCSPAWMKLSAFS